MSEDLRECPFCGGRAFRGIRAGKGVFSCLAKGCPIEDVQFTPAEWTRRTAPPATKENIARLRAIFGDVPDILRGHELSIAIRVDDAKAIVAEWPEEGGGELD